MYSRQYGTNRLVDNVKDGVRPGIIQNQSNSRIFLALRVSLDQSILGTAASSTNRREIIEPLNDATSKHARQFSVERRWSQTAPVDGARPRRLSGTVYSLRILPYPPSATPGSSATTPNPNRRNHAISATAGSE